MSYSPEFRTFVVKKIHSGMSRSDAVEFFNISLDSISKWLKKYEETGGVYDKERKAYKPRKIDSQKLLDEINASPDATLQELSEKFECWPHAIFYHLKKLGITRKKNHTLRGTKRGKAQRISCRDQES